MCDKLCTISNKSIAIQGQNQQTETEERDWDEDDTDDVVDVIENEQGKELVLPMQPTTLEVESNGEAGWTE